MEFFESNNSQNCGWCLDVCLGAHTPLAYGAPGLSRSPTFMKASKTIREFQKRLKIMGGTLTYTSVLAFSHGGDCIAEFQLGHTPRLCTLQLPLDKRERHGGPTCRGVSLNIMPGARNIPYVFKGVSRFVKRRFTICLNAFHYLFRGVSLFVSKCFTLF